MSRIDTSDFLVHFTKGDQALDSFRSIATHSELLGGTGFIKGNYRCVCFTEAPLHALQDILLHPNEHDFKYAPFGVIVRKTWLFRQGGRPVIYQPDSEFYVEALRQVCEAHSLGGVPHELVERLDDMTPLDALINGRTWTAILLRSPECGWSGLDVDLD